ncbi:MAG TPA: hypothetical protein H9821_04760 [Candidatus Rothia avicola]|uniref:HNH endonuclease n=1 Tax=Candidatus Rothia avicola TaxID=2840478 RepID=A0A9D1ZSJ1_9MICC|nr:hypothetical protein [Candidatus Rothia avicola]
MKWSDTSSDHPSFARLYNLPYWTPALRRELTGFLFHCASHSAQHFTDYFIEEGVVKREGGLEPDPEKVFEQNWERLADAALKVGFFTGVYKNEDGQVAYKLIEDPNDFVHLIKEKEAAWNKGRDRDLSDTVLLGKVRVRDGDQCRWCGIVVSFDARNNGRAGTYDHVTSMVVANGDPSKLLVSCRGCNQARGNGKHWDKPLRPVPVNPFYSESTVETLKKWGFHVNPTTPPIFDEEVEPATSSTPSVEPETVAPLVESENATAPSSSSGWSPVEPGAVERTVEPETLAPVTAPAPTAPEVDPVEQMMSDWDITLADGEREEALAASESAPAAAPRQDAHERPSAPQNRATGRISRSSGRVQPDFYRKRQKRSGEALDVPGRDGSGRASNLTQVQAEKSLETETPAKPKRKRRGRRKKKTNEK